MIPMRTCVHPDGRFIVCHHRPHYTVANLRQHQWIRDLGILGNGDPVTNRQNFPPGAVKAFEADGVYEILNPFPFRGATYIGEAWADAKRRDPSAICLPRPEDVSMTQWCRRIFPRCDAGSGTIADWIQSMPEPVQLALAVNSTDPEDLTAIAEAAGAFIHDPVNGAPVGLRYSAGPDGAPQPLIHNPVLFEAVANNPSLPDVYKEAMVLRPGAQGSSPIVGEWLAESGSHVFEYLRRNSYIPGGHYAANMASDAVRYRLEALTREDMTGMRHLYYQRTFIRLAEMAGVAAEPRQGCLSPSELEQLRGRILACLDDPERGRRISMNGTLWGWNFGFDYAPSRYRLHASHQQIHQQYALIPRQAAIAGSEGDRAVTIPAYACGDQIHDFIQAYRVATGVDFFSAYIRAIEQNERTDGRGQENRDLVIYRDQHVMLFVPKAQTSQWEIQIVPLRPVGNILETDEAMRASLDRALWTALRTLENMGARMITTIEYSKRFDAGQTGQRLLYSILPRLPESPGAFSEAQLRWIIGHYPEDFAAACRMHRPEGEVI